MIANELNRAKRRWSRSVHKRAQRIAKHLLKTELFKGVLPQVEATPPTEKPLATVGSTAESKVWRHNPVHLKPGLCVVGYLRSEIGLGQAARCIGYACDAARLPTSFHHLPLPSRENDHEFDTKCIPVPDRLASLHVIGLPAVAVNYFEVRGGRTNILYPFWELTGIPASWWPYIRKFDEIWAPSSFIASAFAGWTDRPVRLLRQPVRLPAVQPPPRRDPSGTLRFLTFLDYDSYSARKNPMATVKAFADAFDNGRTDVELVVKTRGERADDTRDVLTKIAGRNPRITVIDATLDRSGMDKLMQDCDVFVSLHRSEGFGFGAAEALAAGKAVIATDYGGTTDFISELTGYPIAYDLVEVGPADYVAHEGQVWANARHEAAVSAMRAVLDNPGEARARAEAGFEVLRSNHSFQAVGAEISRLMQAGRHASNPRA